MIIDRSPLGEDYGDGLYCRIWLDEPMPKDFAERLLVELFTIAEPVGLGHMAAIDNRHADQSAVLAHALLEAARNPHGRRHFDNHYWFDYVSGYRIKVSFYPEGTPVDDDDPAANPHPGLPLIASAEFEEMYGATMLEGAVRLALAP